jgi:hypothetical protein
MDELGWIPKFPELEAIVDTAWQWRRKHPNGFEESEIRSTKSETRNNLK